MKRSNSIFSIVVGITILVGIYAVRDIDKSIAVSAPLSIDDEIRAHTARGQLYIQASGALGDNCPKILINGEIMGYIDAEKLTIEIEHGDVVEIDGRGCASPVRVTITGKSSNVAGEFVGRSVNAADNIQNIGTFSLK